MLPAPRQGCSSFPLLFLSGWHSPKLLPAGCEVLEVCQSQTVTQQNPLNRRLLAPPAVPLPSPRLWVPRSPCAGLVAPAVLAGGRDKHCKPDHSCHTWSWFCCCCYFIFLGASFSLSNISGISLERDQNPPAKQQGAQWELFNPPPEGRDRRTGKERGFGTAPPHVPQNCGKAEVAALGYGSGLNSPALPQPWVPADKAAGPGRGWLKAPLPARTLC